MVERGCSVKRTYYIIKWRNVLTGEQGDLETVCYDTRKEAQDCIDYFSQRYPSRKYVAFEVTADSKRDQS